ncbi:MAG: PilZ domain-containing protein [Planctomycetota bacterium]|nr:PilZ domain-containing protein [Planctomycetota bacterium]
MSGIGLQSVGTRISTCSTCETPLPLSEAADLEDARIWVCSRCGTEYNAVLAPNYSIDELRGIRPEPVIFDPQLVQPVAPAMLAFAQRFGARDNNNVEKRSSTRHPVIATLTAWEFDEQLRPVGEPFQTICRNLSSGGVCLINDRAILSEFLVLDLGAAGGMPIQTLARVLRRRPLGPYHDIGTELVTKLATSNSKMLGQ